ncbi:hypothetical protein PTSG_09995 [Salpingoeca rosetta]|uniref:Oligosaccharyltransferase complex subunit n=1 Tax=Salpingoeca rosetta (strain ATCC 50818 / BSB-021) TaxID=946362 RepID=F2UP72_SALR5|nr:uncharacterized protein PTSG_09995 [Salpingoeca rosetta]EGD79427.1 hypothetical protein PTSG_09995 [Salpingoeca rosetta]|eukprot:XP_004988908.1 hypothetical protein PTSG_09995 [Salpingoeca rosetta]
MEAITGLYAAALGPVKAPSLRLRGIDTEWRPSSTLVLSALLLSYFLVTAGIIYDMIIEPPSIGYQVNEHGRQVPVAFMQGRINGQFITEGLSSAFMFLLGGLGFIALDQANQAGVSKTRRMTFLALGSGLVLITFLATRLFMSIKLPGYLR